MNLCIAVPCNSEKIVDFLFCDQSLYEIKRFKDFGINVSASIVFQSPITEKFSKQFEERLTLAGIEVRTIFKESSKMPTMVLYRQESFSLFPNSDFYLIADHNLQFQEGSAEFYSECIAHFLKDAKCGMILCAGHFGSAFVGKRIVNYRGQHVATQRGILLRNFSKGNVFPKKFLSNVGGAEEWLIAALVNASGFSICKKFRCPTLHKENLGRTLYGDSKDHLHSFELMEANNFKSAREVLGLKSGEVLKANIGFGFSADKESSERIREIQKKSKNNLGNRGGAINCLLNGVEYRSAAKALHFVDANYLFKKKIKSILRINGRSEFEIDGIKYLIERKPK